MKRLLRTAKKAVLATAFFTASAFSYLSAQQAPSAAQEPTSPPIVGYAKPDDAIPNGTNRIQGTGGAETGDFTGSLYGARARTTPISTLSLAANLYGSDRKRNEVDRSSEFFDFGGGFTQTTDITDTIRNKNERSLSVARGEYAGVGIQFSSSKANTKDFADNLADTLASDGSQSITQTTQEQKTLPRTTLTIVSYASPDFHVALIGRKQRSTTDRRSLTYFFTDDGAGNTFDATIEDLANDKRTRTMIGASGSYAFSADWFGGLDIFSNKLKQDTTTQHVEIQNGTTTANTSTADSDTWSPVLVRGRVGYDSDTSPLSAAATIGYAGKEPRLSHDGKEKTQAIGDFSALARLNDKIGLYGLVGLDAEAELLYLPALVFFDSTKQRRMHDFGRFAADQHTLLADPAADDYQFREYIHGLSDFGWSIGAFIHTQFDSIQPGSDLTHIQPFLTGNIVQVYALSITGDITDEGSTAAMRHVVAFDLGKAGIIGMVGEAGLRMLKKIDDQSVTQKEARSTFYGGGLEWRIDF